MSEHDLKSQLRNIRPGQQIVYHTGEMETESFIDGYTKEIKNLAWALYAKGDAVLVQRKVSEGREIFKGGASLGGRGVYQYIAIGYDKPIKRRLKNGDYYQYAQEVAAAGKDGALGKLFKRLNVSESVE